MMTWQTRSHTHTDENPALASRRPSTRPPSLALPRSLPTSTAPQRRGIGPLRFISLSTDSCVGVAHEQPWLSML